MTNQSYDLICSHLNIDILKHLHIRLCWVEEVHALELQVTLTSVSHFLSDWLFVIVVLLPRWSGEQRGDLIESSLHFEHFCDVSKTAHHIEKDLHIVKKHGRCLSNADVSLLHANCSIVDHSNESSVEEPLSETCHGGIVGGLCFTNIVRLVNKATIHFLSEVFICKSLYRLDVSKVLIGDGRCICFHLLISIHGESDQSVVDGHNYTDWQHHQNRSKCISPRDDE